MTEMQQGYVFSLSLDELREQHLSLMQKYEDRGVAMQATGNMVRSLYVCNKCGKRFLIIGESYCHCPETVKPRMNGVKNGSM